MSDTRNVKIGVCQVYFDGVDLGYTQGGVEVEVSTETHKVEVDQFGKSPINEIIMSRDVKVKCPLAETTIENMVRIMPGATMVATGAASASGTVTPTGNFTAGNTLIINGKTVTAKTSGAVAAASEFNIGGTLALSLAALVVMLNASTEPAIAAAQYSATSTVLTVTASDKGVAGNSFTLGVGSTTGTVSGATLTGGTDATAKRVDVTNAVSTDLLSIAKELRLHPQQLAATDKSQDFIIPLAATAGALKFAYKLENERIFDVEFMGYPDTNNGGKLFSFGDPAAV